MRVCVTGLRGIPNVMGGVETHCEQLYPRLKALLPQTEFEVLGRRPYLAGDSYDFSGVRVTPIATAPGKFFEAISHTFASLFYARFVKRADLLHIHAIGPGVLAPLAILLGLKVVVTHHGEDYRRQKWNGFAKTVLRTGEWLSVAAAHRVIAVALTLSKDLQARYPSYARKVEYIPNGMADVEPKPNVQGRRNALTRYGLTPGGYVLAVGRLVPEKRFDDLIEAMDGVTDDKRLLIVGAADHEDQYSRALTSRASDRVIFAGALQSNELTDLYKDAAAFVLPSSHEGLPITVLEAIQGGAPVIVSDIAPNLDLGLPPENYFPMGDVAALRDKLNGPLEPLRIDAASVASRFDWNQIAFDTARLYRHFGCQ